MKNMTTDSWQGTLRLMQAEITRRLEALHALGFRPAFYDFATCALYASRHSDGSAAEIHDYDGLPDEVVIVRTDLGRVIAVKASLITGYERNGYFFTHTAALRAVREWRCPAAH